MRQSAAPVTSFKENSIMSDFPYPNRISSQIKRLLFRVVLVAITASLCLADPLPAHRTAISAQAPACGPMDVAFVVDDTGSMGSAINNVKAGLTPIINSIQTASGGDYRLALVTFKDNIKVRATFAPNNSATIEPLIMGLFAAGGDNEPEASDEALNTVVNALPAAGRPQDLDFLPDFRPGALKVVILITDAPPGGFDDAFTPGVDDLNAHARALEAQGKGIKISAIRVSHGFVDTFDATNEAVMQDYATTTGGQYLVANPDGTGVSDAINNIIETCGGQGACSLVFPQLVKAASGQSISFRICNSGPAATVSVRPFFNSACFSIFPGAPQRVVIPSGGCAVFQLNAINCPQNAGKLPGDSKIVIESDTCGSHIVDVEWVLRNRF
jgi:hypothetical protein